MLGFIGTLPGFLTFVTTTVTGLFALFFPKLARFVSRAQKDETLESVQHKKNIELHEETERSQIANIQALNAEMSSLKRELLDRRFHIKSLQKRVTQLEHIFLEKGLTVPDFVLEESTEDA